MNKRGFLIAGSFMGILGSTAPVRFSPTEGLRFAEACAQTIKTPIRGGCCRETDAICVFPVSNGTFTLLPGYYFAKDSNSCV